MGYSIRLQLTLACSLNAFQLVVCLYRGHPLFFLECVYPGLLYSALIYDMFLYSTTRTYPISKKGKVDQGKQTLRKREDDLNIKSQIHEKHSNCKEWVKVSLSTPLTRPCAIYVPPRKQQAGNIHVCNTYERTK